MARVQGRQLAGTGWVSHLLQSLAVAMWSAPGGAALLERGRETYRRRREALASALQARGIEAHGRSGMNLWVPVAEEGTVTGGCWMPAGPCSPASVPLRSPARDPSYPVNTRCHQAGRLAGDIEAAMAPRRRTRLA